MAKKGGRNRRGRGDSGGSWQQQGARQDYQEIRKANVLFEKYYNELEIVPSEEYEEFWAAFRRELPNSFRFTGSKGHALSVQKRLIEHYIPKITSVKWNNGEFVEPPQPIEWYPEKLAWSMTTPKNVVRRFPPFASFQKFLVSETSVGNISRQEVVSMIPPLVLDLWPGMTVLDLCAAPGSKSAQLIELVHGGEESRIRKVLHRFHQTKCRSASPSGRQVELDQEEANAEGDWSDSGRSTGLLVANDVDVRRAQMLVHQVKRLNSPNLIVTNHDASQYPSIRIPSNSNVPKYLKFDRILADVPCSGDGTARKNPGVWRDWSPGSSIGLYDLQLRILVRALQMLKVGGRMVYSTCSMNPVENEAVVACAIDRCGGPEKVRLLDSSKELPGLKRRPGLTNWKVMDKAGNIWSSWEDFDTARASASEPDRLSKIEKGMFPPAYEDEGSKVPLEHCMRIYPHLQDTGGFFVAILEKQSEIKARQDPGKKVRLGASSTADRKDDEDLLQNGTGSDKEVLESVGDHPLGHGNDNSVTKEDSKSNEPFANVELETEENESKPNLKRAHEDDISNEEWTKKIKVHNVEPQSNCNDERPEEHSESAIKSEEPRENRLTNKKPNQPLEEPYKYLAPDHPELLKAYDFYQISTQFPRDRFMVRNAMGEPAKAIYYTSTLVRDILKLNEGKGLKFVQSGVKMFVKQDAQGQNICRWRIQSEGMPILEPWVGEDRIVRLYKRPTLHKLLIEMFPKLGQGNWTHLGEIGERVNNIGMGCCVLRVEPSDSEDGFEERVVLPLWRSISSVNLMLPKEERKAMLLRLYDDDSPLIGPSKDKTEQAAKGSSPNMKDGSLDMAEEEQTLNGTGADCDGKRDNTSSEQADS